MESGDSAKQKQEEALTLFEKIPILKSMKKILLLIDDYVELTFLETMLKKIGFDTIGYQGFTHAKDKLLELLPDLLILSDEMRGKSTSELLEELKKTKPQMKSIILRKNFSAQMDHPVEAIDFLLKSPVDPLDLLKALSAVLEIPTDFIVEKYLKLGLFQGQDKEELVRVVSGKGEEKGPKGQKPQRGIYENVSSLNNLKESQYSQALKSIPASMTQKIDSKLASREAAEFRNRSGDAEIQKIDQERQSFVKALFKK